MSECEIIYPRNYKLVGTTFHFNLSKEEDVCHISLSRILEIFLSATSIIVLSKEEICTSRISLSIDSIIANQIHAYSLLTA
jgi:hypothetical protein